MAAKVATKKLVPVPVPNSSSSIRVGKVEMARKARAKSMTGAMFEEDEPEEEINKSYDEQLQLAEPELKEEYTRVLTADNPNAIKNLIIFNYKEMAYQQVIGTDQCVHHIDISSKVAIPRPPEKDRKTSLNEADELAAKALAAKPAPNKFNYNDRAAQTYNLPLRHQEMQTLPPPRQVIIGNVSQGEIYDAYTAYAENLAKVKGHRKEESTETLGDDFSKISLTIKIMERMVNQNIFDEIMQDFKYWEDKADEFRIPEGMLLPLWKFSHDDARGLTVTAVKWSAKYNDLFAATYGSVDYLKQEYGMICIHTLKNPAYPEFIATVDSGLLCVDIHSQQPYLIAVGYYDGNVAVFDVKSGGKYPKFQCDPKEGKHQNPVWKVKWQENNLDGNLNFVSISADGRVTNWVLYKSELRYADIVYLHMPTASLEGPGGAELDIKGAGTAIAFHRLYKTMFIIGTEEGKMYKCSKIYSNRFLQTYNAHSMAIHEITWNAYHPDIFLTCSADWSVKLWDYKLTRPLFVFDLNSSVSDVAWAPYAATVFAACTTDGKVFVFDLHINKYKAVCEQIVVQKKGTALSSISFNQLHPIIVVGDSKGFTTCLKLSPNLRRAFKENKTTDPDKYREIEMAKLFKILAIVRLGE